MKPENIPFPGLMARLQQHIFRPGLVILFVFLAMGAFAQSSRGVQSVFLHADRDMYVAGETAAFAVFTLQHDTLATRSDSWIFAGLTNPQGDILSRKLLHAPRGFVQDVFVLPDTLSSGLYFFTAFTGLEPAAEYVFRKPVFVFNRFDARDPVQSLFPAPFAGVKAEILSHHCTDPSKGIREVILRLSSDGGGYLQDSLEVLTHAQDSVPMQVFATDMNGIGHFRYPATTDTLQLVLKARGCGSIFAVDMHTSPVGCLSPAGEQEMTALTGSREFTYHISRMGREVLQARQALPFEQMQGFPPGIYMQHISRMGQRQGGHTLFFYPGGEPADPLLLLPQDVMVPRAQVQLDTSWIPQKDVLQYSMALVPEMALFHNPDLAFYTLLMQELYLHRLVLPSDVLPLFVSPENATAYLQIASVFTSGEALKGDYARRALAQTAPGMYLLDGYVTLAGSKEPVAGQRVTLNVTDTVVSYDVATTDEHGYFRFELSNYLSEKMLVVRPETDDASRHITLIDPFEVPLHLPKIGMAAITERLPYIANMKRASRIQREYQLDLYSLQAHTNTGTGVAPLLYSRASTVYYPEEYAPLDNFTEISREIIPALRLRSRGGAPVQLSMVCNTTGSLLPGKPAVFLNGIALEDLSALMPLGSSEIERIELLNVHWRYGNIHFPGILSVFTQQLQVSYPGHPALLHQVVTNRQGALVSNDLPDEFFPDFRQLLLWQAREFDEAGTPAHIPAQIVIPLTRETFRLVIHGRTRQNTHFSHQEALQTVLPENTESF